MAYGIQIFNTNGTSEIFGSNVSGGHLIISGQQTLAASGQAGDSATKTVEGMTATNFNTIGISSSASGLIRPTISRGTGSFTMTNPFNAQHTFQFYVFRF